MSGPGLGRGPFAAGVEPGGPSRPVGAALPLLRRAARFFVPYQGRLVLIATLILASSVIGLANPYLLKLMIDDAFPKRDIGLLGLYASLMVIVPIINGGIGLAQSWMTASVGQFVMRDLRNLLLRTFSRCRFDSFPKRARVRSRVASPTMFQVCNRLSLMQRQILRRAWRSSFQRWWRWRLSIGV